MKINDNREVQEDVLVKVGDVLFIELDTRIGKVEEFVIIAQVDAGKYNLIELADGNRYFESIDIYEVEEMEEIRTYGEGIYVSDLMKMFSDNPYKATKVNATLEVK